MRISGGRMYDVFGPDGKLSDETCRHITEVLQTKSAILKYIEPIAHVLAEAGRASAKAMGDDPHYAVDEWSRVIRLRAHEILRADNDKPRLEAPTIEAET